MYGGISIIYNFISPSKNGSQEKKQKYVQYSKNKFSEDVSDVRLCYHHQHVNSIVVERRSLILVACTEPSVVCVW